MPLISCCFQFTEERGLERLGNAESTLAHHSKGVVVMQFWLHVEAEGDPSLSPLMFAANIICGHIACNRSRCMMGQFA
jgi:hypothetical protein